MPIESPHNSESRRPRNGSKFRSNGPKSEARATQAPDALDKARRSLVAGQRRAAIDVLEDYLEANPQDDEAMELLVQAHRGEEGAETGKEPAPFTDPDEVEVEELDWEPSQAEPIESTCKGTDERTPEKEVAEALVLEAARRDLRPDCDAEILPTVSEDSAADPAPDGATWAPKDPESFQDSPTSSQDLIPKGRGRSLPSAQEPEQSRATIATLVTPAGPRRKSINPLVMVVSGLLVASIAFVLITRPWTPSPSPEPSDTTPPMAEAEPPRPQDDLEKPQEPLASPDADTVSEKSLELTSNESQLEDTEVSEAPREDDGVKSDLVEAASIRPGTLIVLASPWAKVASIRDEHQDEVAFEKPAFTPFRLDLPPGRYSVSLERPELPVCTRSVQITPSAVTTIACRFGELEPMDLLERIGS